MAEHTDPVLAVGAGESGADTHQARQWEQPRGLVVLWSGLLAGPVAWSAHLGLAYLIATGACSASVVALWAVTAACLALALWGARLAWTTRAVMHARRDDSETALETRSLFMARSGVWLGVAFALVILVQAIPLLLMPPSFGLECDGPRAVAAALACHAGDASG